MIEEAELQLQSWRGRPLDMAFLRAALGSYWMLIDTLDKPGTGMGWTPSQSIAGAEEQAEQTGWLADVGNYSRARADDDMLSGEQGAQDLFNLLMSGSDEGRAAILTDMLRRGELLKFLHRLGFAYSKALHDALPTGYGEIKNALQSVWRREGALGTDLEHPEEQTRSLNAMVEDWAEDSVLGKITDVVLDVGTFGFNETYGDLRDSRAQGLITDEEYDDAVAHAALKTAAVATVAMASGGMADKAVRGGAASVGLARSLTAGAVGGAVGGVADVGTADAYDVYVSGTKDGFSSPEDYVKAALLGGAIGAGFSGVAEGLSRGTSKYLARGATAEAAEAGELASTLDGVGVAKRPVGKIAEQPVDIEGGHRLKAFQRESGVDLILCSECGPVLDKLRSLSQKLPPEDPLRVRLGEMEKQVDALQKQIDSGAVAGEAVDGELAKIAQDLEQLHGEHHGKAGECAFCAVERSAGLPDETFSNKFPDHEVGVPFTFSPQRLMTKSGRFNYVVTTERRLIVGEIANEVGGGHIDLAGGHDVLAAGEVVLERGEVMRLDNSSGHYEPHGPSPARIAEEAFEQAGFRGATGRYVEKRWDPARNKWIRVETP